MTPIEETSRGKSAPNMEDDSTTAPDGKLPGISSLIASEGMSDSELGLMSKSNGSFDEALPDGVAFSEVQGNSGGSSVLHSFERSFLITTGQVERLPHLEPFRKAVCKDQVQRLHEILDSHMPESDEHKQALADLRALSLRLAEEVRNWRRTASYAPELPIVL